MLYAFLEWDRTADLGVRKATCHTIIQRRLTCPRYRALRLLHKSQARSGKIREFTYWRNHLSLKRVLKYMVAGCGFRHKVKLAY